MFSSLMENEIHENFCKNPLYYVYFEFRGFNPPVLSGFFVIAP